jgi:hypothetical protein
MSTLVACMMRDKNGCDDHADGTPLFAVASEHVPSYRVMTVATRSSETMDWMRGRSCGTNDGVKVHSWSYFDWHRLQTSGGLYGARSIPSPRVSVVGRREANPSRPVHIL